MDNVQQKAFEILEGIRSYDIQTLKDYKWTLAGLCLGSYAVFKLTTHHWNLPPGPISLPIIGGLYTLKEDDLYLVKDIDRLSKKYGPIFSIDFGPQSWIMVTSPDLIKEVCVTRGVEFANRSSTTLVPLTPMKDEIFVASYSEEWKRKKKFGSQALKMFGFGTQKGEQTIINEVNEIIRIVNTYGSKPFSFESLLENCCSNVIHTVWFGERFDFDSPELRHFIDLVRDFIQHITGNDVLLILVGQNIPKWMHTILFRKHIAKAVEVKDAVFREFMRKIQQHRETLDKNNLRDAVDVYLSERYGEEGFNDEVLVSNILSLLSDAIDTLTETLRWILLYLCLYPDVQSKIQKEIDIVCGQRPPRIADKPNMPYTEATVYEIFRHSNSVPASAPHTARETTTLRGYTIPKDVPIWLNFYSVNTDPKIWTNPEQFKPERHLNQDGHLLKTTKELITPFGLGRRMCMGEPLAKNEIFLVVTNLLYHFTLSLPKDRPKPSLNCRKDRLLPSVEEYFVIATPQ